MHVEDDPIAELRRACDILTQAPLTAKDAAGALGTITVDHGGSLQIDFRPNSPAFSRGGVTRTFGTEEPSSIQLAPAGALEVRHLQGAFGDYTTPPRVHYDAPLRLIFQLKPLPGRKYTCALIASVKGGPQGVADGTVSDLTIRRDILLAD